MLFLLDSVIKAIHIFGCAGCMSDTDCTHLRVYTAATKKNKRNWRKRLFVAYKNYTFPLLIVKDRRCVKIGLHRCDVSHLSILESKSTKLNLLHSRTVAECHLSGLPQLIINKNVQSILVLNVSF